MTVSPLQRARARVGGWARACFTLDLRSLALFRIGLGVLVVLDVAFRALDAEVFYSDTGVLPRSEILRTMAVRPLPSLYLLDGSVGFQLALFAVTALCGLALALGWRTRTATVLCWVLIVSVQNRHSAINTGADSVEVSLLMWAIFLPLGARFSLDARRGQRAQPEGVFTWAAAAVVLQLVIIYVFNVVHKNEAAWWQGTAVMMTLHIDQHATPLAIFLREHAAWLGRPLSYGTIVAEASALLLLVSWRNTAMRLIAFTALWSLHIGFAVCLQIGLFSPACMVGWLAVLPAAAWSRGPLARLERRLGPSPAPSPSPSPSSPSPSSPSSLSSPPSWRLPWPVSVLLAALLLLELVHNMGQRGGPRLPRSVQTASAAVRAHHTWRMFGSPGVNDGWYVVPGTLRSGREVDLFRAVTGGEPVDLSGAPDEATPVSFDKPSLVSATFPTARWRKFMMNSSSPKAWDVPRKAYARWLCRTWNAQNTGDDALVSLRVVFVLEKTRPRRPPLPPKPLTLLEHTCR